MKSLAISNTIVSIASSDDKRTADSGLSTPNDGENDFDVNPAGM